MIPNDKIEFNKKKQEIQNQKNLERFIHITTYSDKETMKKLKLLFEEINKSAFGLHSVNEIYIKELTESERNNNEIDYISGFQILDKNIRITIIEGITGKGIKKVKEAFPRYQMNNNKFKIFCDSNILFNKRVYSKFNLQLKMIKLRYSLEHILTTYEIYSKAKNYRQMYNAFLNLGAILRSNCMKDIVNENLFSKDEDLFILERKYGVMLTEEDLTGIKMKIKLKKKIKLEDLKKKFDENFISSNYNNCNTTLNEQLNEKEEKKEKKVLEKRIDSYNNKFDQILEKRNKIKISFSQRNIINKNHLLMLKEKMKKNHILKTEKFCEKDYENQSQESIYFYSGQKENFYVKLINSMSQKYYSNKDKIYAYSTQLSSIFPVIEPYRNESLIEKMENKKKWISKNDFNRFSQPRKEKFYFPKIDDLI